MKLDLYTSSVAAHFAAAESRNFDLSSLTSAQQEIEYVDKIANKMGHKSILEHNYYTFHAYEMSRHLAEAIGSFEWISIVEKSQRYTVSTELAYLTPGGEELLDIYTTLLGAMKKEDARFVLPLSVATSMVFSVNERNVFELMKHVACYIDEENSFFTTEIWEFISLLGSETEIEWSAGELEPWARFPATLDSNETTKCLINVVCPAWLTRLAVEKEHDTLPLRMLELAYVDVRYQMSSVCYQQLKRYRTAICVPCKYKVNEFIFPEAFDEYSKIKEQAIIGATARNVFWRMNFRDLFFSFLPQRLDSHAQNEIQTFATNIVEAIYVDRSTQEIANCFSISTKPRHKYPDVPPRRGSSL
jgi:thymidylate synthase ThyX